MKFEEIGKERSLLGFSREEIGQIGELAIKDGELELEATCLELGVMMDAVPEDDTEGSEVEDSLAEEAVRSREPQAEAEAATEGRAARAKEFVTSRFRRSGHTRRIKGAKRPPGFRDNEKYIYTDDLCL